MSRCLSLNVVQAAIQSLIDKLEPLFPEIAGMTVSSDGLIEAIHGCELRLVHAYEAVLVRPDHSFILYLTVWGVTLTYSAWTCQLLCHKTC